jgi:hypothetical protein
MPRLRFARLGPVLAALAACLTLATAADARSVSKNLLRNPGFEGALADHEWMPANWDTSVSGLPTVFFGRDTLLAHGGSYSVSLANLSVLFPMGHNWSQTLLVDSTSVGRKMWGKDLVFSVWTRSVGIEGRGYILLQAYRDTISKMALIWNVERENAQRRLNIKPVDDPLLDFGWKRQFFSDNETEWVRREVRVYCPPTVNVLFIRLGIQGTGQLMFDDASLTVEDPLPAKLPSPGENLLAEPGFEADGSAWEYSMPAYRGMRIEVDSTVAHSGRKSVRCQSGEGEYVIARSGACQVICNRALQGKRVRLTAWCKTDSLRGTAYTKIYCHTLRGMKQVPQGQQAGATVDWMKTTLEMDVPRDTYSIWVWCAWDAPVAGLVYYDDVTFEVIGPAEMLDPPLKKSR